MKEIILLAYLIVLSIFDLREKKVPLVLLSVGTIVALCFTGYELISEPAQRKWILLFTCLGMIPGIVLLAIAWLTEKTGYGDGLALVNVGMVLGYRESLILFCFSVLLAAIISIGLLLARKANRQTSLPYLPFLAAAYLAGLIL